MPPKLGKGTEDLFKKTEPAKPERKPGPKAARPPKNAAPKPAPKQPAAPEGEPTEKVTVLLTPSQITLLDELCLAVRKQSGRALRRTEVVRALIEALRDLELNLNNVDSEGKLRDAILKRLG